MNILLDFVKIGKQYSVVSLPWALTVLQNCCLLGWMDLAVLCSFCILVLFQVLTGDNFGILAYFQALIAENFGIFSLLYSGKNISPPRAWTYDLFSLLTTLPTAYFTVLWPYILYFQWTCKFILWCTKKF